MDTDGFQETKAHRQYHQRAGSNLAQIDNAADTDLGTPNPRAADNDWERTGSMDPVEKFDNPNPITDGETSTQPQKSKGLGAGLREVVAAVNQKDSKLARLVGQHVDDSAKGYRDLRETMEPAQQAAKDSFEAGHGSRKSKGVS